MLTTIYIRTCLGYFGKIRVLSRGVLLYWSDLSGYKNQTLDLPHCRQALYQLSYSGCSNKINNDNRTEWNPIRSAISCNPMSSPICLITSMITDRILDDTRSSWDHHLIHIMSTYCLTYSRSVRRKVLNLSGFATTAQYF